MSREAFNQLWATAPSNPGNDASFSVPRDSIWGTGWEGGADKDAPKAGEQNWWQNRADFALQDIERYGVMTYASNAIYAAGAPVKASDGNYYESLSSNNSGQDPTGTTGYWRLIGTSLYGSFPIGGVITVAHNGVPDVGWLKCNGAVLTRATYPRLFDKLQTLYNTGSESTLQFRLPDYRGEFLRGFDDSRGIDNGRVFGSFQNFQVESHIHATPGNPGVGQGVAGQNTVMQSLGTQNTGAYGGNETRPRNRAVNYWIKY